MPYTYRPAKAAPVYRDERVTGPALRLLGVVACSAFVLWSFARIGAPGYVAFLWAMLVLHISYNGVINDLAEGISSHRRWVQRCNDINARYTARQAASHPRHSA